MASLPVINPLALGLSSFYVVDGVVNGVRCPLIHQGSTNWTLVGSGGGPLMIYDEQADAVVSYPFSGDITSLAAAVKAYTGITEAVDPQYPIEPFPSVTKSNVTGRLLPA